MLDFGALPTSSWPLLSAERPLVWHHRQRSVVDLSLMAVLKAMHSRHLSVEAILPSFMFPFAMKASSRSIFGEPDDSLILKSIIGDSVLALRLLLNPLNIKVKGSL